jgi:hypothetical protein
LSRASDWQGTGRRLRRCRRRSWLLWSCQRSLRPRRGTDARLAGSHYCPRPARRRAEWRRLVTEPRERRVRAGVSSRASRSPRSRNGPAFLSLRRRSRRGNRGALNPAYTEDEFSFSCATWRAGSLSRRPRTPPRARRPAAWHLGGRPRTTRHRKRPARTTSRPPAHVGDDEPTEGGAAHARQPDRIRDQIIATYAYPRRHVFSSLCRSSRARCRRRRAGHSLQAGRWSPPKFSAGSFWEEQRITGAIGSPPCRRSTGLSSCPTATERRDRASASYASSAAPHPRIERLEERWSPGAAGAWYDRRPHQIASNPLLPGERVPGSVGTTGSIKISVGAKS